MASPGRQKHNPGTLPASGRTPTSTRVLAGLQRCAKLDLDSVGQGLQSKGAPPVAQLPANTADKLAYNPFHPGEASNAQVVMSQSPMIREGPGSSSSKDKSSLQSSFDADQSGIRHLYQIAGVMADQRQLEGQAMAETLLFASEQLDDEGPMTEPGLNRSPFATMASARQEWEGEGWQSMKRKNATPETASRSRRRTLDFTSPKKQDPGHPETGSMWQNTMPSTNAAPKPKGVQDSNPFPRLPTFTNSSLGIDIPQHRFRRSGYLGSGSLGSQMPGDDSPGALSNAFAAALGSGYIPPGGATTALPLGPTTGPSVNYSGTSQLNRRGGSFSDSPANSQSPAVVGQKCNCKKSRCLKLYCVCFAAGQFCLNCTCANCSNTPEYGEAVMETRSSILARNQNAFEAKVKSDPQDGGSQHKKGCHCKKSNCKKKYCECFQAGVNCGSHCKCENCMNQPGDDPAEPRMPSAKGRSEHSRNSNAEGDAPPRKQSRSKKATVKQEADKVATTNGLVTVPLPETTRATKAACDPPAPPPTLDNATSIPSSPPAMLCNSQMGYQATGTTLLRKNMCMREEAGLDRPIKGVSLANAGQYNLKGSLLEMENDSHVLMDNPESLEHYLHDHDIKRLQGSRGFLMSLQAVSSDRHVKSPTHGRLASSATPNKPTVLLTHPLESSRAWSTGNLQHSQTLASTYYQLPEGFDLQELPITIDGGLEEENGGWANSRIEDLEDDGRVDLDSWVLSHPGDDLEKNSLISSEDRPSGSPEMDAFKNLHAADNQPAFAGWTGRSPSPNIGKFKRKYSVAMGAESPVRYPLGTSNRVGNDRASRPSPAGPLLAALPSFDPLGGIPHSTRSAAMRKHSAAPPSLPNAERAYGDDFINTMHEEGWLHGIGGGSFPHAGAEEGANVEDFASYAAISLQHSHSLPNAAFLPEASASRGDKFGVSPNRANSLPYPAAEIKSEHGGRSWQKHQDAGPSPKKLRINRISGTESANGFYKINSGMTTILSPPKLH